MESIPCRVPKDTPTSISIHSPSIIGNGHFGRSSFADLLAPPAGKIGYVAVPPPSYAQQGNFQYDLCCIPSGGKKPLLLPTETFNINELRKSSSLDNAQATSVVEALSRGLTIIQGPPGRSKSYTRVALTRILLANKEKAAIGPILCVYSTKYALDYVLEKLLGNNFK
ncbi:hypothetical protein CC78DRAFT_587489 [Lojkania enalia]|uniref:DNA2/NAM7 helicase helicase domain-containing protein n=1 Tax=Lojkania enalia TaxID=147567 RepID=A0A9P4JVX3_9PLEO|nr:hypothetical protein CC78DRAFT_587489 [Didymosphaeria enalia]